MSPESIPDHVPLRDDALAGASGYLSPGESAIAAPDGSWVVEPVSGEEMLVVADVDPSVVRGERHNFDPAGHYFRGDVIRLSVDRSRLDPVTFED